LTQPVLMDFVGIAGPLHRTVSTQCDVLEILEEASQHTTLSYQPLELFSGELWTSSNSSSSIRDNGDDVLDYTKCDMWMLGFTLFATL
jgi:hypothetical protein